MAGTAIGYTKFLYQNEKRTHRHRALLIESKLTLTKQLLQKNPPNSLDSLDDICSYLDASKYKTQLKKELKELYYKELQPGQLRRQEGIIQEVETQPAEAVEGQPSPAIQRQQAPSIQRQLAHKGEGQQAQAEPQPAQLRRNEGPIQQTKEVQRQSAPALEREPAQANYRKPSQEKKRRRAQAKPRRSAQTKQRQPAQEQTDRQKLESKLTSINQHLLKNPPNALDSLEDICSYLDASKHKTQLEKELKELNSREIHPKERTIQRTEEVAGQSVPSVERQPVQAKQRQPARANKRKQNLRALVKKFGKEKEKGSIEIINNQNAGSSMALKRPLDSDDKPCSSSKRYKRQNSS